jgi:hypothetical protein
MHYLMGGMVTVIVTIYLKNRKGPSPTRVYDLDKQGLKQLKNDFEQHHKEGIPKTGEYMYHNGEIERSKSTWIDFDDVERIECE